MKNYNSQMKTFIFLISIIFFLPYLNAAQEVKSNFNSDSLISAARQLTAMTPYCTLITLDTTGHPDARTMEPFSPDSNMVIWLGTNLNSGKVKQIKRDSRVTLFYASPNASGYVVILGNAYIIDDSSKKQVYWKNSWDQFYSEARENYTLIKVVPHKLKILDYTKGIVGDSKTWTVPLVEFDIEE